MTAGLTKRQSDLLAFIVKYGAEHDGVAPTYDEMKDALGLVSKSGIHRMMIGLLERGAIDFIPERSRSVRVIVSDPYAPEALKGLTTERLSNLLRDAHAIWRVRVGMAAA